MSNKRLTTDLSQAPYFDDFDSDQKYVKYLIQPRRAVQSRELNGMQAALQEQVGRFGDFTFKNGAVVDGIAITYIPKQHYVHVLNELNTINSFYIDHLDGHLVTSNTGIRATVRHVERGFLTQYPLTNRLYVDYIQTGKDGANNDISTFSSGETLTIYGPNQPKHGTLSSNNILNTVTLITANASANSTGTAFAMTTSPGMIYQKGFFLNVDSQFVLVNALSQNTTGKVVGFDTAENIITEDDDPSLVDNSNGSNANAPGAHRLELVPFLVAKNKSDIANTDFFAVVEFDTVQPVEQNTGEEGLNRILDIMAVRTEEESGNYVVKPFAVEPVKNATANSFTYEVSSGITYVNGYRKEKLSTTRLTADTASSVRAANARIVTANYGSYLLVNELSGALDSDHLDEVVLYDTAQLTVSQYEGSGSAPSGAIVGYANVLGVEYDSGQRGTPSAVYRLYVFNVRMNSGKSLSTDAKSVYATSGFGDFKADVVLTSGKAILQDAARSSLVFPFGINAVKRLRDAGGVNDTQFVFKDLLSATMAANGVATFTLNSPANGGQEQINASPGVLSNAGEEAFTFTLSAAAYSANLAGTVSLNASNGMVLMGTATTFTNDFIAGDMLRVDTGSGIVVRSVTAIANNTWLTIDADIVPANSAAKFSKYYPAGHVVNMSTFGGTVNVLSNTQFTVDTNLDIGTGALDSGTQTLYAYVPVLRTQAVQAKKTVNKGHYGKLNCSNNVAGAVGPWDLGVCDTIKLRSVMVGNTANTASYVDATSWFFLDNGQRDTYYDHARLVVKPQHKSKITAATQMLVSVDYLTPNTAAGVGFFSVDSYPIDDANTANTAAIHTAEIPVFVSSVSGQKIDLRNAVDFRPIKTHTTSYQPVANSAVVNPAVSGASSFTMPGTGQYVIAADTNFQADLEYYLPRVDLICINKHGDMIIRSGLPDENPIEPLNESDTAVIARVDVAAYPSLGSRKARSYGRPDLGSKVSIKTHRRYTMKDIGALETRISRMEYYTTLNLLEQQARDMVITDENGLDRFKNGIFADSFVSHKLGKVDDIEYSIAVDRDRSHARPKFTAHDVDFYLNTSLSSGVVKTGYLITRPFTSQVMIDQPLATKYRNCAESVWQWTGMMSLYPPYDHSRDEINEPSINVDIDLTAPWDDFVSSPFGTLYGDWRTTVASTSATSNTAAGGSTTTTTTTSTSTQLVQQMSVSGSTSSVYDLGSSVVDVSLNPFMRSRLVAFVARGLKPNTTIHAFFDGINVDQHVAPGNLSGVTGTEGNLARDVVTQTGAFGAELRSSSTGAVQGLFMIPEGTFRVGDRAFILSNVDDLIEGEDAQVTNATALFTASNMTLTSQQTTLTTHTPELNVTTLPNVVVSSNTVVSTTPPTPTTPPWPVERGESGDPIAQSFHVIVPDNSSGMFVTEVGVYFKTKDSTLGVSAMLMEMRNGWPVGQTILGRAHLESADVSTSNDSSVETKFTFFEPVFLNNSTEYVFVIKPDGNSPEYNIWAAETGGYDVLTDTQVFSNPYSGTLFVSANMGTWSSKVTEDLKFKLYRAAFSVGSGTATFNNEMDEYFTVDGFTKTNVEIRPSVGDIVVRQYANGTIVSSNTDPSYGWGVVQYIDESINQLVLDSSNGKFAANTTIQIHRATANTANVAAFNANTKIASSVVQTIDDMSYHAVVPRFAMMQPAHTAVSLQFKGTDSSYTPLSYNNVANDFEKEFFDVTRKAVSRSNEVSSMSGDKSSWFTADLSTSSTYVSPVIDMRRKSALMIENLINDDSTDEHTQYGNALTKYVSRNVTLSDEIGPAEDINVFVGAYRPAGTDVEVYIKMIGADDGEPFDSKLWTKLTKTPGSALLYSNVMNTEDYRELAFNVPSSIVASVGSATTAYLNDGIVQYARSDGALQIGFTTFSLKIVLLSSDPVKIPRISDIRAIALQK